MRTSIKGLALFIVVIVIGFNIGMHMAQAVFFGSVSLIGLIVLIESIKPLKWLLSRSSRIFDIIIFVFTILATISYGVTIAASLTVVGLGYTLFYGPYLREQRLKWVSKKKKKPVGNYRDKFNFN